MVDYSIWIEYGFGRYADLRGADLQGADLQGADLRGADLQGADLRYAYLRGADLRGADLQRADLQGADLRGADLQGADLQGADLDMSSGIPFWCGGVGAKLDRRIALQMLYHFYNQNHQDKEIKEAIKPLKKYALEFLDNYRSDAPELIEY